MARKPESVYMTDVMIAVFVGIEVRSATKPQPTCKNSFADALLEGGSQRSEARPMLRWTCSPVDLSLPTCYFA